MLSARKNFVKKLVTFSFTKKTTGKPSLTQLTWGSKPTPVRANSAPRTTGARNARFFVCACFGLWCENLSTRLLNLLPGSEWAELSCMNEKGEIEEPFTQETRNYKMIDQRKIDLEKIHYQKKHARINKKPSFFTKF